MAATDCRFMSSRPLVTIGIPTYNRPEGLRRVLEAALAQTWPDLEIIVSDNASPNPEVAAVIAEFMARDQRLQAFRQPENVGAFRNFLFVLERASGEFFMWLADDDAIAPHFVRSCVETLEAHPDSVLALTPVEVFDERKGQKAVRPIPASQGKDAFTHERDLLAFMMQNPNLWFYGVYRTAVVRDVPFPPLSFGSDQLFMVRVADRGRFAVAETAAPGFTYTRGSGASGTVAPYRRYCGAERDVFFVLHYVRLMLRELKSLRSVGAEQKRQLCRQFLRQCFTQRSYRKNLRKELFAAPWRAVRKLVQPRTGP